MFVQKSIKIFFLFLSFCIVSCMDRDEKRIMELISEWEGKSIRFPSNFYFTRSISDTVQWSLNNVPYKILSYVDSAGCMSCKLQLSSWKNFVGQLDSICQDKAAVLLFLHPKKVKDIRPILISNNFDYPVCIDVNDSLNKLNHFPSDMAFQTFLLDKDNKVLAIGNPVLNPKVKELYLKIIQGKPLQDDSKDKQVMTTVSLEATVFSMGDFAWQEERQGTFRLKNTGEKPLVIQDIVTSCGCLTVDYSQEPVMPGKEAVIGVTYKADSPGYFNKVVTVYCNAEDSPIRLRVNGNAQ